MKTIKLTFLLAVLFMLNINIQAQEKANGNGSPVKSAVTNNAAYLSQSTPGEMKPGQTYNVSVTMKNSGNTEWKKGSYALKLTNVVESIANVWNVSSVDVNASVVAGEQVVFNFSLTAPMAEGSYNMQWQMAEGNAFFGEPTISVPIKVTGPTVVPINKNLSENNSAFVYQSVATEMDTKQTYDVKVIMKNTGSSAWKPGEYKLNVSTKGGDNTTGIWQVANVELSSDVYSESEVTFTFKVTAPEMDGTYNFQCQIMKSGMVFGEPSTNVIVKVN